MYNIICSVKVRNNFVHNSSSINTLYIKCTVYKHTENIHETQIHIVRT